MSNVKKINIDNKDFVNIVVTYDAQEKSVIIHQKEQCVVTTIDVLEQIIDKIKIGEDHA